MPWKSRSLYLVFQLNCIQYMKSIKFYSRGFTLKVCKRKIEGKFNGIESIFSVGLRNIWGKHMKVYLYDNSVSPFVRHLLFHYMCTMVNILRPYKWIRQVLALKVPCLRKPWKLGCHCFDWDHQHSLIPTGNCFQDPSWILMDSHSRSILLECSSPLYKMM